MTNDRSLVESVLRGDRQAFIMLIEQNERLVTHMVARVVDIHEDREEICQDVFMKVHDKLGDFSFQSKLSTWIATIAYRTSLNYLSKKKIKIDKDTVDLSSREHLKMTDNNTPESQMQQKDTKVFLLGVIDTLPVHYRSVLTLFHLDEMNHAEISEVMDMPVGTVKNYLFRARKLLKEGLEVYIGKEQLI